MFVSWEGRTRITWTVRIKQSVKFGLAWDAGCDVDGSVALFDSSYECVDIVSYAKLRSKFHKAVEHSGDDMTGWGGGDDEIIKIRLRRLPPKRVLRCLYGLYLQQIKVV